MRKIYIKAEFSICVDADDDLTMEDIIQDMDFCFQSNNSKYDVEFSELKSYNVEDSK